MFDERGNNLPSFYFGHVELEKSFAYSNNVTLAMSRFRVQKSRDIDFHIYRTGLYLKQFEFAVICSDGEYYEGTEFRYMT